MHKLKVTFVIYNIQSVPKYKNRIIKTKMCLV